MRHDIRALALPVLVALLGGLGQATADEARDCLSIGGVGTPNFCVDGPDRPLIISATLVGTVQSAAGRVLAQRETESGLEMDLEHYFGRDDGGAFLTRDRAVLTAVPGRPDRYMIEVTYDIQEDTTRGTLEGMTGQFSSYGLVDLRDSNDLQGLVRYSGEICR